MVARLEHLLGGDQQLVAIGNGAGDMIGQSAVGEADIGPALDEDDLRTLVQAAQARCRRRAARDATDDDDLHVRLRCLEKTYIRIF
nr:hypothetical protein [Pleomorphomonas koreensis]